MSHYVFVVYSVDRNDGTGTKIGNVTILTQVPADQLTDHDIFYDIFPLLEKEEGTNNIAILNIIKLARPRK